MDRGSPGAPSLAVASRWGLKDRFSMLEGPAAAAIAKLEAAGACAGNEVGSSF